MHNRNIHNDLVCTIAHKSSCEYHYKVAGECDGIMAKYIREGYSVFAKICDRKGKVAIFGPGGVNKMLLGKVKEVIGDSDL